MELTEEQNNCPHCHEKGGDHYVKPIEDVPEHSMGLELQDDGWHLWTSAYESFTSIYPINYCPVCRRPLKGEKNKENLSRFND